MSVFQVIQFTVFSWWIAVNPIVFNIGQINCPISGRLSERPTYGQKNGLISGRFSEKSVLARNTGFFMAVTGKGRLGRFQGLACAACFEEPAGVFAAQSPAPCIHLHELFTCRQQIGRFFDFVCQFCCQWVISAYCRQ